MAGSTHCSEVEVEGVPTSQRHHRQEEPTCMAVASEAAWVAVAWEAGCNHKRSCSRSAALHRLEVEQPYPLMAEDSVEEADREVLGQISLW